MKTVPPRIVMSNPAVPAPNAEPVGHGGGAGGLMGPLIGGLMGPLIGGLIGGLMGPLIGLMGPLIGGLMVR